MNKFTTLFLLLALLFTASSVKSGFVCEICQTVVGYGEAFLSSNSSEQEVETFLDNKVCDLLPSSDQIICKGLVTNYPELVDYIIKREDPNTACTQIGLCSNSTNTRPLLKLNKMRPLVTLKAPKASGVGCIICEAIFAFADKEVGSNATEQEVENFLDNKVCALLPSIFGQECQALVNQYYPELVQYILNKDQPSVACANLGLCTSTNTRPLLKLNKMRPLVTLKAPKATGFGCVICEAILSFADKELGSNATEQEVENFLDNKVCALFPSSLGQECDALVQQYLPDLVQYIIAKEQPSVACAKIGLCTSTNTRPLLKLNKMRPLVTLKAPKASGVGCIICEAIFTFADEEVGSNATEQEVENFLDNKVCSLLPSIFGQECQALVNQYYPELVQYILNKDQPSVACANLGLCTSTNTRPLLKLNKMRPLVALKAPKQSMQQCVLCQTIVSLIEARVSEDSSDKEIEEAVTQVCESLGDSTLIRECNQAVSSFITEFETEFHKTQDVATICKDLHYC